MKKWLKNTTFPVQLWSTSIERQAEQQLHNVAALPFLFHHIAVMPDVHWGIGATVGTVLASQEAIIPAAVGVDIGCGVRAVQLPFPANLLTQEENRAELRQTIEALIPVGFKQHNPDEVSPETDNWCKKNLKKGSIQAPISAELREKARLQLGTLGGGNHFVEICQDEQDHLWLMLHSGSRHIGKQIADYYIRLAKQSLKSLGKLKDLPDANLAYFQKGDPAFQAYLADLFWAQSYAYFNREEMTRQILSALYQWADKTGGKSLGKVPDKLTPLPKTQIDCHHNYVSQETHFGRKVYVTRKGAVAANTGQLGIIPGSMGAASYIVEGLGNPDSFCSCAHGAGRAMSRREAKKRYKVADLVYQTKGVECRKDAGVLDEIPSAYKDIDEVMENQADLVEIRHRLKGLICVKG